QSGDFAYDEETLIRIADRWHEIAEKCREARQTADAMTTVQGPGLEYASSDLAEKANASGRAYLDMLEEMQRYCEAQDEHCRKALGTYQENEGESENWLMRL